MKKEGKNGGRRNSRNSEICPLKGIDFLHKQHIKRKLPNFVLKQKREKERERENFNNFCQKTIVKLQFLKKREETSKRKNDSVFSPQNRKKRIERIIGILLPTFRIRMGPIKIIKLLPNVSAQLLRITRNVTHRKLDFYQIHHHLLVVIVVVIGFIKRKCTIL